ncbi:Nucleoporin nup84 [Clydaea vesicula]|uniref:Nuclear pore complex protein n=1 Tax=Clydaea vesicula TaxID=447962 RepID=A0AAD5U0F5_9FUNG|nr:Nucleoporin nup84 [Clydaea vesicula]
MINQQKDFSDEDEMMVEKDQYNQNDRNVLKTREELYGDLDILLEFGRIFKNYDSGVDLFDEHYGLLHQIQDAIEVKLNNAESKYDKEFYNLELNTWDLVSRLFSLRSSMIENKPNFENKFLSDHGLAMKLFMENDHIKECYIVKEWLEHTAKEFEPVSRRGYLTFTLKEIRAEKENVISQIDPDATTRQNKNLAVGDEELAKALNKTLYEYVRRGQVDNAIDLCVQCEQPWKAATFRDGDHEDDNAVAMGNSNKELWKYCCALYAKNSNDIYEKALYSFFAGEVEHASNVCNTWEDLVWIKFNALIEYEYDQFLEKEKIYARNGDELNLPSEWTKEIAKKPVEIFSDLASSEKFSVEANNPFRIIQAFLIIDDYNALLHNLKVHLEKAQIKSENAKEIPRLHAILRFVVHLIIISRSVFNDSTNDGSFEQVSVLRSSENYLIKHYLDMIKLADIQENTFFEYLPFYCKFLPADQREVWFSQFLYTLSESRKENISKEVKEELLSLAKDAKMNSLTILKGFFELKYRNFFLQSLPSNSTQILIGKFSKELDNVDLDYIDCLEYLSFSENCFDELLYYSNRLCRRFLLFGRLNAFKTLLSKALPQKFLKWIESKNNQQEKNFENITDLNEYLAYQGLFKGFKLYFKWEECLKQEPEKYNKESYNLWEEEFKLLTQNTEQTFSLVCQMWADVEEKSDKHYSEEGALKREEETELLKEIYSPEIFFFRHNVLYSSSHVIPENLERSLKLVEEVSENVAFTLYFKLSKKLEKFLSLVRKSSLKMLAALEGGSLKQIDMCWGRKNN